MKRIFYSILVCLLLLNGVFAQPSSCPNLDFESGSLVNWTGSTGTCCPITLPSTGLANGRHTIMSGPGFDPHCLNNDIPVVAPGGGLYSVRLGNDNVNNEAEALQYVMTVTNQSNLFIYRYAVVMEDPSHSPAEQPRFELNIMQGLNTVPCGFYSVVASANNPDFISNGTIRYKKWTTVGIDLSPYMGQQITIEFRTGDCDLGGHFGYAYFDCSCGPLVIANAFCPNSPNVTLRAPQGFASYLWSTGDTLDSLSVSAANVGVIYSCTLTSVTGCTITLSTSIASTSINANFGVDNNCLNDFTFADSTTVFNGNINQWYWDFGDGVQQTGQNPTHIFPGPGTYDVQLISQSDASCRDTILHQVTVFPSPEVTYTVDNVCTGYPTSFDDSVVLAFGNITSYQWDFGDGSSGSQSSPVHMYPAGGQYTTQLVVMTDLGCTDTATVSLSVYAAPIIEAGRDTSFCGGALISLGDPTNPGIQYNWTPNTGIIDSLSAFTAVNIPDPMNTNQNYTFLLSGVDPTTGCEVQDSVKIFARATPVAEQQTPGFQCFGGNSFNFEAKPTFPGTGYAWFFGPNATPSNQFSQIANAIHYNQPGKYEFLLVVNNAGCIDSLIDSVRIVDEPVIQLNILETGCPPLIVDFTSIVNPAGPMQYEWNFSDNTTSTDIEPTHTFIDPGQYSVSLNVTDADGCSDFKKLTNVITVLPRPTALFATEPNVASILEPHFTFMNLSQNGYLVSWDFGDGTYSTDSNTSHTYSDTGMYFVSLIMANSLGCSDTARSPLRIEPYFNFYVPNAFTPNGDGVNDSFRGLGVYIRDYEMRIYNRWGSLIYVTNDYNSPWDGKGELDNVAQNEVYEYMIRVTDTNDREHEYIGHVSLVR